MLQTFRDKEPFSRNGGTRKERVIVLGWAPALCDGGFLVPTLWLPIIHFFVAFPRVVLSIPLAILADRFRLTLSLGFRYMLYCSSDFQREEAP